LLLFVIPCFGQNTTTTTGKAETTGSCSPAVSGSNNKFTITCENIPEKFRVQFVDLLNRLAKNESDAEAMLTKLDGCLAGVKDIREQQQPWQLTENQKSLLRNALSSVSVGTAKVSVHVLPSDRNASLMGSDIVNVLAISGWMDNALTSDFNLNPQLVSVHIIVRNPNLPQTIALLRALRAAGIDVRGELDAKRQFAQDDDAIVIAVGSKPTAAP